MKRSGVALVAGLLLCLTGCGTAADPPPVSDPTVSASPTKAAPTEPVLPDAASRETKAGAIAFASYYWRVVDYSQRARDTGLLHVLQAKECAACTAGRAWIDGVLRLGGDIRGGRHRIVRTRVPFVSPHGAGLILTIVTTAQRVSHASGMNTRTAGGREVISMGLSFVRGRWNVVDWKVLG